MRLRERFRLGACRLGSFVQFAHDLLGLDAVLGNELAVLACIDSTERMLAIEVPQRTQDPDLSLHQVFHEPALARGRWVVCDRFVDSTRVYQGIVGKAGRPLIKALEKLTVGDGMPDLTFVLDVPAQIGLTRASARRGGAAADRFESEDLAYHEAISAAFREIAAAEPERCVLIDASRPEDKLAAEVWRHVCKRLHPESAPIDFEALAR